MCGVFLSAVFLTASHIAYAATPRAYVVGPTGVIAPGSTFTVSVYIDTTEPANAIDMELGFPKDKITFLKPNDAGSIVDLWQTKARVLPNGNIGFSGGIMRSFTGEHGLIVKLSFKAVSAGNAQISFIKKDVLIADGKGTRVIFPSNLLALSLQENAPVVTIVPSPAEDKDTTPPEFTVTVVDNPSDGVTLVVFNAKDPESGIKQTAIRSKKWWTWSAWSTIENPAVYPSGAWQIEVKSENNKGLETAQLISYPSKLLVKIIFPLLAGIILVYILKQVYNKSKYSM